MDLTAAEAAFRSAILFGEPLPPDCMPTLLEQCRRSVAAGDPEREPMPDLAWFDDGDEAEQRRNLETRLRRLAVRAADQTAHYGRLFRTAGVDPAALSLEDLRRLPITRREDLQRAPYDFVCRDAVVAYRTHTSGTGGGPLTGLCFSASEVQLAAYLTAIGCLFLGSIGPEDLFMFPASNRQVLASTTAALSLHLVGATVLWSFLGRPEIALGHLLERHAIPGKKPQVNRLVIHPSHLGAVVTAGLAAGHGPADFGLSQVDVGGEIATAGLKRRARRLLGESVKIWEGYGISELWGGGGHVCASGRLHFEPTGLCELIDVDTGEPAAPGRMASVVASTLPPFRDTTLLLRYDTQDMVRPVEACECGEPGPVATPILGKRAACVRHSAGWTTPRDVLEALEGLDAVQLPARCGFWAKDDGVAVEVVAPSAARGAIGEALEAAGVPLRQLMLRDAPEALERPHPLRMDIQ